MSRDGVDWSPLAGGLVNENAGDVIILSAEDDAADTVVPRLIAAGADRTRMHVVTAVKEEDGGERAFNLTLDLDRLEKENDLRAVRLLVIDPVSAYLGSTKGGRVDRNRAGDVRSILGRLAAFAARHDWGWLPFPTSTRAAAEGPSRGSWGRRNG